MKRNIPIIPDNILSFFNKFEERITGYPVIANYKKSILEYHKSTTKSIFYVIHSKLIQLCLQRITKHSLIFFPEVLHYQ